MPEYYSRSPRWPNILSAYDFVDGNLEDTSALLPDGRWVVARPYGFCSLWQRLKATWLVFTGRADALVWPGQ